MCVPTAYAIANGVWTDNDSKVDGAATCWWWLRSSDSIVDKTANVDSDGAVCFDVFFNVEDEDGVRPAMWISLNA
jgi:hypothetical protein